MKWCWYVVSTETPSTANHSRIGHSTQRGTCRANSTQMMTEQRDVQRRRLVERLVEAGQRREQQPGEPVGLRPNEA